MATRGGLLSTLIWPGLFTAFGLVLLIALGLWQLHRLAWKEALIAAVTTRVDAPPVNAPREAEWPQLDPKQYEYRHVRAAGTYDFGRQVFVFRPLEAPRGRYGGPGYLVMTPLRLADGATVIVNRGFVPADRKGGATDQSNQNESIEITGLMRAPEARNWFTPADDPATGDWFTRDPAAIAAALKLDRAAPFTIDADAGSDPAALPEGGETILAFPNNHLSYALTWFGMAIALASVFAAFAWKKKEDLSDGDSQPIH
jgi:surfeit locus 1 family protein